MRTFTSADGAYHADIYKSHWLGEAHYRLYLWERPPGSMFGLSDDGATLCVRADAAVVMEVGLASGSIRRTRSRSRLRTPTQAQNLRPVPQ